VSYAKWITWYILIITLGSNTIISLSSNYNIIIIKFDINSCWTCGVLYRKFLFRDIHVRHKLTKLAKVDRFPCFLAAPYGFIFSTQNTYHILPIAHHRPRVSDRPCAIDNRPYCHRLPLICPVVR